MFAFCCIGKTGSNCDFPCFATTLQTNIVGGRCFVTQCGSGFRHFHECYYECYNLIDLTPASVPYISCCMYLHRNIIHTRLPAILRLQGSDDDAMYLLTTNVVTHVYNQFQRQIVDCIGARILNNSILFMPYRLRVESCL